MMDRRLTLSRKCGFSLVEILVAAVVFGFVAMALGHLFTGWNKGQNTVSANASLDEQLDYISLALKKPSACLSSLGAAATAGINYSETSGPVNLAIFEPKISGGIYVPGTQVLAAHDFTAPRASGKFDEVSLLPPKTKSTISAAGAIEYITSLHATFIRTAETTIGSQNKSRDIPLVIMTDSVGKITGCHTIGSDFSPFADQSCVAGQVVTGFDGNGVIECGIPDSGKSPTGAGILGLTEAPPPGTNALTCTYLRQPTDAHPYTMSCDEIHYDCSYTNGKWVLKHDCMPVGLHLVCRYDDCTGGVTVDFPPEGTIAKAGTDFISIDTAISTAQCLTSTEDQKTCITVLAAPQTTAVRFTQTTTSTVLRHGVPTTVNINTYGVKFDGVFYAPSNSNSVCAYVAGQWKIYRSTWGTNCDSVTVQAK